MGDTRTEEEFSQSTRLSEPIRGGALLGLVGAGQLYKDPTRANITNTYVGIDPTRQSAYEDVLGMAGQPGGSGVPRDALAEYQKTLQGGYLNDNQYLDDIVQRSIGAGQRSLRGVYGSAGRFGSGAFANAAMDAASETASRLYGAEYTRERDRMSQALGLAPQMHQLQYADAQLQEYVGREYEADTARQKQEELRQFEWDQQRQANFEASVRGSPLVTESDIEGESTTTRPFDWGAAVSSVIANPPGVLFD